MQRYTLPRDMYHGTGALEALKTLKGKKAVICVGGGSMKRFGFLDRAKQYLHVVEEHMSLRQHGRQNLRRHRVRSLRGHRYEGRPVHAGL